MPRYWWQAPGPGRFAAEVADQLREGRNVLLRLPDHFPDGLEEAVRAELTADGPVDWVALRAEPGAAPARLLFDRFVPLADPAAPRTPYALTREAAFTGKVIWLRAVATEAWPAWRGFLAEYAHVCRSVTPLDRTLFVAPQAGGLAPALPPEGDVCLAVRAWEDVVEPVDSLLYAARALHGRALHPLHKALALQVLAGLALWDPAVCDALAGLPLETLFRPQATLAELARGRRWQPPAGAARPAWQQGQVARFAGRDQVHSALLALHDPHQELPRRVWRAQVAVLLPFVEERRQELLARLRHHFEVPFRTANGEVIEDVRDLEIGHIEYQLATRGRAVPPEVRLLKRIRNCLAHQETVEPALVFQATAGAG